MMSSKHSTKISAVTLTKRAAQATVAALLLSAPLWAGAAEPAQAAASCNSVMVKTKEFRDAPKEQIQGICKNNRNSPAYWSCMNTRIDKGQKFADAGMRCNKITAAR